MLSLPLPASPNRGPDVVDTFYIFLNVLQCDRNRCCKISTFGIQSYHHSATTFNSSYRYTTAPISIVCVDRVAVPKLNADF